MVFGSQTQEELAIDDEMALARTQDAIGVNAVESRKANSMGWWDLEGARSVVDGNC